MVEPPKAIQRQARQPWQFTLRGLFALTFSVALGLSYWKTEHLWYLGVLAAISFWIVLGLAAQVRDLWDYSWRSDAWTTEERWGWRFAIAWRLAACCLIAAYFLDRWLVTWHVLAIGDRPDSYFTSSRETCAAALLVVLIVAIASSPRFARKGRRRRWSWAINLLGGIAAGVLFLIVLMDRLSVPALVHIAIVGTQMAQPSRFSANLLAACNPARTVQFFAVATAGVVSVLVSYVLLRLLTLCWWRGGAMRTCLGALLAVSLSVMVLLAGRIALVEVFGVSPILAANIFLPGLHQLVAAAVLVLVLVSVAACRWSEPPSAESSVDDGTWRRDEERYHHERLIPLALLLAGVIVEWGPDLMIEIYKKWHSQYADWHILLYFITSPVGCLSLALAVLAAQGVFSGWSKRPDAVAIDHPRLAPVLFLLVWSALLMIVVCSAPILGAWGFALWLMSGR